MSLWCVQSRRHRLGRLAGVVLCALLAVAIYGCGRTPPEEFWEPTKDDTAGIKAVVEANKDYFRTGLAELAMLYCDTALPGTTRTILNDELLGNRFKARFRLNAMEHVLDSHELKYTFIATQDTVFDSIWRDTAWFDTSYTQTTATVSLAETIPGKLLMHATQKTFWVKDTPVVVPPAETLWLPVYSTVMDSCDTVIEKPIAGSSTDGCVLKKVDGVWQLWKMAGGGRFYAPGPDDAPYIDHFYLKSANDRVDTVNLRPDTLHYGIQRFYSVDDQLLTYAVGDWVIVSNLLTNQGDAFDYVYLSLPDTVRRYELKDTVKFDSTVSPGIYRLYLEHIPATVLWEVDGDYNATVWGIPIRIQ